MPRLPRIPPVPPLRRHLGVVWCLAGSLAATVAAALPESTPTAELPPVTVASERIADTSFTLGREEGRSLEPNLGRVLLGVPGVSAQQRSVDASEPNIRGLTFDRIATSWNGLALANAAPERTHAPVVLVGPVAAETVQVVKALASVTLGPAVTGGRIVLSSLPEPPPEGWHGHAEALAHGGRDGWAGRWVATGRAGAWFGRTTAYLNRYEDYAAADGRTVPATLREAGASAALGWAAGPHQMTGEILHRRLRFAENLSLPLDGSDTDTTLATFRHRWLLEAGGLEALEWDAGYSRTEPNISNRHRPAPSPVEARGRTETAGGTLRLRGFGDGPGAWTAGLDFQRQRRDAVRRTASGLDHIWPDVVQRDVGGFAESTWATGPNSSLRAGARLDRVWHEARAADQWALGRTITEQYRRFNGPAADPVDRAEWAGAANLLWKIRGPAGWSGYAGTGYTVQPAPATERYRAFLNALGGDGRGNNAFELGNPALDPERKWELCLGAERTSARWTAQAGLYYYRIDDYLLRTRVGTTAAPPPPPPGLAVYGYRNVPAEFYGAELGLTLRLAESWTIPLTLAWAEGRQRTNRTRLPEIPPLEATGALRWAGTIRGRPQWAETGVRAVGSQSNPTPTENPLFRATDGFALLHLRAGGRLSGHLRWEAGVENLLDRLHYEYLTPPVGPTPPVGSGLAAGEAIPGPGRFAYLGLTWEW